MNGNDEISNSDKSGIGDNQLVIINGKKLKKESLENCSLLFSKIKKLYSEISRFEIHQKPSYEKWLNYYFKDLINSIKEISKNVSLKKRIIKEVQEELFFFNISPKTAFEKVLRRVESGEFESDIEKTDYEKFETYKVEDENDILGEELNEFFQKLNLESSETLSEESDLKIKKEKFKEKYFYLVSKLHPDKIKKELSKEQKEIWNEVQIAYKANDFNYLEDLFVRFKFLNGEINTESSLFDLRFSELRLKKAKEKLTKKKKEIKNSEAWNFTKLSESELFEKQKRVSIELKDIKYSLDKEFEKLNEVIEVYTESKQEIPKKKMEEHLEEEFLEMYLNF